ncbi:MAG: glycosyltransferase family 39 protein [Patescibacteria group bacterium]
MEFLKKHSGKIVALILLLFVAINIVISIQESTTMDEKAHIPSAYSYVRFGDMRLNPEHPPLLKDLAGLPLLAFNLDFPTESVEWQNGVNAQWILGDKFINCIDPSQACNDPNLVTFWSRLPMIFIALLLGVFLYLWTKELAGPVAGLFATLLYATDPNIIAHSHYVTTDIGIAAFLFFAFYFFVHFLKKPSFKNVVWAGVFLGLAQLAKFSAVLLFPIFGMFAVLYALSLPRPSGKEIHIVWFKILKIFEYGFKYAGSVLICFALIWVLYYFNTMNTPGEKLVEVAHEMFPDRGLGPFAKDFVAATHQHPLLKPFSEYFLGVFMVFARVAGGNTYYFLGGVSNHASPWYFPVVFLLKETIPFLFLLVFTTLYSLYRMGKTFAERRKDGLGSIFSFLCECFRNKITQFMGVFFVLFYAYISITGNLNIGFRHLFPILPFLYMFIAKVLFDYLKRRKESPFSHTLLSLLIGGFALSLIAIPVLAYPNYLSYFNAIAGGHTNGYRYVTDSNYDWGQDVKRLKNFVDSHNRCIEQKNLATDDCSLAEKYPVIDRVRVDYFGGSSPQYYLGDKYVSWHSYSDPEPGWYAISIGFFQESTHTAATPGEKSYKWLNEYAPVARAGDSIFIFYVPEQE